MAREHFKTARDLAVSLVGAIDQFNNLMNEDHVYDMNASADIGRIAMRLGDELDEILSGDD